MEITTYDKEGSNTHIIESVQNKCGKVKLKLAAELNSDLMPVLSRARVKLKITWHSQNAQISDRFFSAHQRIVL